MNYPHENIKHMIFSFEKYDAIYFRVPKVASTSILISFRKIDNLDKVETYDPKLFKFAFVRNPFDRIASCFRHIIKRGADKKRHENKDLYGEMSFGEFVDVVSKRDQKKMDIHFRPQHTFFPEKPDYIGRFENLNEDFAEVVQRIGIKGPIELLHENKTDKTIFKDYYSDEEIVKKVVKLYKKDFELFDYPKTINL